MGKPYDCDQCDYKSLTLTSLSQHITSVHEGAKYVCNQCHYRTTCLSYLQLHKRSIHVIELWVHSNHTDLTQKASYACYHCDYEAADKNDLQRHLRCKHEKGLAKTSMIAFFVIIMEIIRIIFHSILDLDMRVWHMFVMNIPHHIGMSYSVKKYSFN